MFGIADSVYASRKLRKDYIEPETDWKPEIIKNGDEKSSWFCFVPRIVSETPFLRERIIPKEGDIFVYTISSLNLIKPNPDETIKGMQEIYDEAIVRMRADMIKGHALNILGVSLGNVLSTKAAGSISKIEKLVSIVGGDRLGLSAWDSILTGNIAKQSRQHGCNSKEEYEKRLSLFSPINYIGKVAADEIIVRLGTNDLLIPYKYGKELAGAFIERGKKTGAKVDYKSYLGADHSAAIFFSAIEEIHK